jgi:hypothetical protein
MTLQDLGATVDIDGAVRAAQAVYGTDRDRQ